MFACGCGSKKKVTPALVSHLLSIAGANINFKDKVRIYRNMNLKDKVRIFSFISMFLRANINFPAVHPFDGTN